MTFDPCSAAVAAPGATAAQIASIDAALAGWSAQGMGVTRVAAAGSGVLPISFRTGGESEYGYYDDAAGAIYVNVDLTDDAARAVAVAHELGHAFGLVHVPLATRASVMNPGNLTIAPSAADAAAVAAVWGACAPD